jgi:hypothetical protein
MKIKLPAKKHSFFVVFGSDYRVHDSKGISKK